MNVLSFKKKKKERKKKGVVREWVDAIVFAVIAASLIRWLVMEAFTIPTPSMEKSLLVGDYLFVSKFHYGSRTFKTPLQVPLTHQKVPVLNVRSYLDWIQLPFYRLPGFSEIKRNDPVVFNYPMEFHYPVDMKTYYIKRCIGLPGDNIKIINKKVHIDGNPIQSPGIKQTAFSVYTNTDIRDRVFKKLDITDVTKAPGGYIVHTTKKNAEILQSYDFISNVEERIFEKGTFTQDIFPEGKDFGWTVDNFGPLHIPAEGETIDINDSTLAIYKNVIMTFDGNENPEIRDNKLFINGEEIDEYTFKQDYYFMMGDNRHNSLDSRYWGFVPQDHVVGKALFIWFSLENGPLYKFFTRVRWGRLFMGIE